MKYRNSFWIPLTCCMFCDLKNLNLFLSKNRSHSLLPVPSTTSKRPNTFNHMCSWAGRKRLRPASISLLDRKNCSEHRPTNILVDVKRKLRKNLWRHWETRTASRERSSRADKSVENPKPWSYKNILDWPCISFQKCEDFLLKNFIQFQ